MNKLRIVILEPNADIHPDLLELYETFFLKKCGYQSEITFFSKQVELEKYLQTAPVDIFISDLSLDKDDYSGLLVVKSVKTNYPEIYCIGNSRKEISYRQTAQKLPTFDLFIDKKGLFSDDNKYLDHVSQIFLSEFKKNTDICINTASELGDKFKKMKERIAVESLVSQVTFSGHENDSALKPTDVILTPLSGGRSSSSVFRMTITNKITGVESVPAVLKISKKEYAQDEIDNYNRFVKWILPYKWRADMLGVGFTKDYGAICYAFILSGSNEYDSLTHFLINAEYELVKSVFEEIFSPKMRRWYGDELIQHERENINKRYVSRHFKSPSSTEASDKVFINKVQDLFNARVNGDIIIDKNRYPLPVDKLFSEPFGGYFSCICHGDLNSNNVIIGENNEIIFIDFQSTGRGHSYEDFISMEASILLHYKDELRLKDKVDWRAFLLKQIEFDTHWQDPLFDMQDYPASFHLIKLIRSKALQNFNQENWRTYHYGLAMYTFRLLRVVDLNINQIGVIISNLLSSMTYISNNSG
jgi:hypothetical protein